jgi:isopentenyl phosphate kinase
MILVKLGGSVITDKAKLRTFKRPSCNRLAKELSLVKAPMAIVHGAGSFGHIEAKKHSLHKGFKTSSQLHHVAAVQRDVRELNLRVLASLIDNSIRAVSVPPSSAAKFRGGMMRRFDPDTFGQMFDLGLTPVSFGDVVPDESMGFSICSGDLMMEALAKAFRPHIVVFCADVDGVFDADPRRNKKARLIPEIDRTMIAGLKRSEPANADVTGSIYGKVERMLAIAKYCEKCMIVNGNVPGRLGEAVSGRRVVSTVVIPG